MVSVALTRLYRRLCEELTGGGVPLQGSTILNFTEWWVKIKIVRLSTPTWPAQTEPKGGDLCVATYLTKLFNFGGVVKSVRRKSLA